MLYLMAITQYRNNVILMSELCITNVTKLSQIKFALMYNIMQYFIDLKMALINRFLIFAPKIDCSAHYN